MRVPPTEKAGRVQTSFVTVAIMKEIESTFKMNRNDIEKKYVRSQGAGGQNVNKVNSCCQLTHIPTGIQVKCQDTRDQNKNEVLAYQRMYDKLKAIEDEKAYIKNKNYRNDQIGNGSDETAKRRTYRVREDTVIDHITDKTCRWKDILKGRIELLS